MGRTRRKRKRRHLHGERGDFGKVINLQKSLRLKCTNIQIHYFDEIGWGVKSKKQIDEGEIIISLPLNHLITPHVQCDIFPLLRAENQPPQLLLSIFLVYELHVGNKSKYYDYIETLPRSFTNLYFCTKDEVKLLPEFLSRELFSQGEYIDNILLELFHLVNDKSCPHCGEKLRTVYSRENVIWAWFIVNTRSVYFEDEEHGKSLALAPFLDLFNHSDGAVTQMFIDLQKKLYILKTLVKYKKHDQVFIKYGAHSNVKLLMEYGFILPENTNDFVEFSFQEIVDAVKKSNPQYGEITKSTYNFIKSNKLDQNLTKGAEFSWNFKGLISVLTTADRNLFPTLQSKLYSNAFTSDEKDITQKIIETVGRTKCMELERHLLKMETTVKSTESFRFAKQLIKIYIGLLS